MTASTTKIFAEYNLSPTLLQALDNHGFISPSAVQESTIPLALSGHDLIAQAPTGTGKTLGFGIPILQSMMNSTELDPQYPAVLIIVPTRELCQQVYTELANLAPELSSKNAQKIKLSALYGGIPYAKQLPQLAEASIIIGTPGRILDLTKEKHLDLSQIKILVLDEADEMLNLGFLPDVNKILHYLPTKRQSMLFSATMPDEILKLSMQILHKPTHIHIERENSSTPHSAAQQFVYRTHNLDKNALLIHVLHASNRGATIIFTRTKRMAAKLAEELKLQKFKVGAIHGDLIQKVREEQLQLFKEGELDILVATDLAARGLDIDTITHVINYHCPDEANSYVHRIGRTARAGRIGTAITFIEWDELPRWKQINQELQLPFDEPIETYSSSDHIYDDLNIPRDAIRQANANSTNKKSSSPHHSKRSHSRKSKPSKVTLYSSKHQSQGKSAEEKNSEKTSASTAIDATQPTKKRKRTVSIHPQNPS